MKRVGKMKRKGWSKRYIYIYNEEEGEVVMLFYR